MTSDRTSLRQKEHYARIAEKYAAPRRKLQFYKEYYGHIDELLFRMLPAERNARILDDLCGNGELLAALCRKYRNVCGLDISMDMLLRFDRESFPGASLYCGDALMLPFKEGIFDAVTIRGGLHHLPRYGAALREVHRVLKTGGVLVLHEACDDNPVLRFSRRMLYKISSMFDADTEHGIIRSELSSRMRDAGFRGIEMRKYGFLGYLLLGNPDVLTFTRALAKLPGMRLVTRALIALDDAAARWRILRSLNMTLIAVARK